MGSGASTSAKVVNIDHVEPTKKESKARASLRRLRSSSEPRSTTPSSRPPSTESRKSRKSSQVLPFTHPPSVEQELSECKEKLEEAKKEEGQAKCQIESLEKQVWSLESQVLDLQEQISGLQELTEQQHKHQLVETAGTTLECNETVHAKDSYIEQLEAEMQALKSEANKVKARLRKKLKAAKSELAESKHESSLQILDLREEIGRLMEENCSLMSSNQGVTSTSSVGAMPSADDGRTSIIVDLSSRLSEQDTRISELEAQIKEKDAMIKELQAGSKPARKVQRAKSMPSRALNRTRSREKLQDMEDAVEEEDAMAASPCSSPKPSNHLLMTAKSDAADMQELRAIAKEMMKVHTKRQKPGEQDEPDARQSSGISRDSGVLSMEVESEGLLSKQTRAKRPTSGTSTLSAVSNNLEDDDRYKELLDWNSDSSVEEEPNPRGIPLDNIRQISAPKRKLKISVSEFDYVDKLLSTSQSDLSGITPSSPVTGKPPSCGRVSSMRSPRSPSHSFNGNPFAGTNQHVYTIGHV